MAFPANRQYLAKILDCLACPACHGALSLDAETLTCTQCRRTYPIQDGIPLLISDHTEPTA